MSTATSDDEGQDAFLAEMAEREAFEARFPAEKFGGIASAIGLPAEPGVLAGLRLSLLHPFYFFYVISSGKTRSREEWICGVTELRDAARALLKSLRYNWALVGASTPPDDPIFDPGFRGTVGSIVKRANEALVKLRSESGKVGAPTKWEFREELLPELARIYEGVTKRPAKAPRYTRESKANGGFRSFVVAVCNCLYTSVPGEISSKLPSGPLAVREELRKHGY